MIIGRPEESLIFEFETSDLAVDSLKNEESEEIVKTLSIGSIQSAVHGGIISPEKLDNCIAKAIEYLSNTLFGDREKLNELIVEDNFVSLSNKKIQEAIALVDKDGQIYSKQDLVYDVIETINTLLDGLYNGRQLLTADKLVKSLEEKGDDISKGAETLVSFIATTTPKPDYYDIRIGLESHYGAYFDEIEELEKVQREHYPRYYRNDQ